MDELDRWLTDMQEAADTLADPRAFFDHHRERYTDIAQRVAFQTLSNMRPEAIAQAEWQEKMSDFIDLVWSRQIAGGLEIYYVNRTELDRINARQSGINPGNYSPISYNDVLEWVMAGPDNGGKDPSEVEITRDRSPYNIAYDVHQAILQHRLGTERKDFSRITRRLEDWVNSRLLSGDMDEMLRAIVEAWQTLLAPVIERDYSDWMDDVLRN
jgi:hypothetical protein